MILAYRHGTKRYGLAHGSGGPTGNDGPDIADEVRGEAKMRCVKLLGVFHDQGLRQAGSRGSDLHRTHEPLHLTRDARDPSYALKIAGKGVLAASIRVARQGRLPS